MTATPPPNIEDSAITNPTYSLRGYPDVVQVLVTMGWRCVVVRMEHIASCRDAGVAESGVCVSSSSLICAVQQSHHGVPLMFLG